MSRDDLDRLAGNPEHIPGIYNYCDRWCERCTFTAHCLTFAVEQAENQRSPDSRDPENQAFWDRIAESQRQALDILHDYAAEEGVDLNTFDEQELEADMAERERQDLACRRHPIAVHAMAYPDRVKAWMDAVSRSSVQADSTETEVWEPSLPGTLPDTDTAEMTDAVEVIQWYQYFLYPKLMRALGGREQGEELAERYDFPKDSDGSAKIALIAIDRSIGAWTQLQRRLPTGASTILELLVFLNRLRKLVETEFPAARSFQRPGFDYLPE